MDEHYLQWLNLLLRWIHVIAGVAWIGASFYFNWLEGNLNRQDKKDASIEGDLWAIHGGGFYQVTKFKTAPEHLPAQLHWFKWEAYLTWISGFFLLAVVYYLGADRYLIAPELYPLSKTSAVGLGLGSLILAWFVYDTLCKANLAAKPSVFAGIFFTLACLLAWALTLVFNSRGAYMHLGAALGTIMAANVFRVIIPNQKLAVAAMLRHERPDPNLGKKALQRSLHNNYLTLPVLFIMISNHYPQTFANHYNWQILACLCLIGAGTRHYFNLKNRGQQKVWILPLACLAMLTLAFITKPASTAKPATMQPASFTTTPSSLPTLANVTAVFKQRCVSCHSSHPSDSVFHFPPNGVIFDTPEQIISQAGLIKQQVVVAKRMPLANKTMMTEDERELVAQWLANEAIQ